MGLARWLSRLLRGGRSAEEAEARRRWLTNSGTLTGDVVSLDRVKRRIGLRPASHPGPVRELRVMAGVDLAHGVHVGMRATVMVAQWGRRVWATSVEAWDPDRDDEAALASPARLHPGR